MRAHLELLPGDSCPMSVHLAWYITEIFIIWTWVEFNLLTECHIIKSNTWVKMKVIIIERILVEQRKARN